MRRYLFPFIFGGLPLMAYNPKDGYFVEGGITTGMVETAETIIPPRSLLPSVPIPKRPPIKRISGTTPLIQSTQYSTQPIFTQDKLGSSTNQNPTPIILSAAHPIAIKLENGNVVIQNFLPYNLTNVDITMNLPGDKDRVIVGRIADLKPFEITTIPQTHMPEIAKVLAEYQQQEQQQQKQQQNRTLSGAQLAAAQNASNAYIDKNNPNIDTRFLVDASSSSNAQTKHVLGIFERIWVDITAKFAPITPIPDLFKPNNGSWAWGVPTPYSAKLITYALENLAAVLSSPQFKQAVLHAPFAFVNGPGDYNPNVVPLSNGQAKPGSQKYVLSPETVYKQYTTSKNITVDIMSPSGYEGLGSPAVWGVQPGLINYYFKPDKSSKEKPPIYLSNDPLTPGTNIWPLITIWHEWGHVNGYSHNGDMTYQNGWFNNTNQAKPNNDAGAASAWDRFDKNPGDASGLPFVTNKNGTYFLAGMGGLGVGVWTHLGATNQLPINYKDLPAAEPNNRPSWSFNKNAWWTNPIVKPVAPIEPLAPPKESNGTENAENKKMYDAAMAQYQKNMKQYETDEANFKKRWDAYLKGLEDVQKNGTNFDSPVWYEAWAKQQAIKNKEELEKFYNEALKKAEQAVINQYNSYAGVTHITSLPANSTSAKQVAAASLNSATGAAQLAQLPQSNASNESGSGTGGGASAAQVPQSTPAQSATSEVSFRRLPREMSSYSSTFLSGLSSTLNSMSRVSNKSAMVGFNVMGGYQHYFNDTVGMSYYGIMKYNYAGVNKISASINQVGLGVGSNVLIDFYTKYTTIKEKDALEAIRRFDSSLGMFAGLRALWQGYGMLGRFVNAGNLNFTTGFNYRVGHSKYSLGISVPMISYDIKVATLGNREISIKEGPSHFNVFFNYGWVF
ncbi:outer membrane protein [Helicobacter mustelae]|uniref:hypothetical protein n=1 Tax=Helicobacter mustelae TaxID=217 RepID=UPI000E06CF6C|nr:hypothetical protein [Helicobacter mustelae]STP12387.1 outer membrane protein [Helicobacter mustelae]